MANYCTLDEIKASLDITEEQYDDLIQAQIIAVKTLIDNYTERQFDSESATIRYFDGGGTCLFIDDLVSASSISLDEDGDAVYEATMATTDYILYPLNKSPKTRIELSNESDYGGFASGIKQGVKITGTWGYSAVPAPINQASIIQVCRWFKRRESAFQDVTGSPELGQVVVYKALDPEVKLVLEQYRKRRYP